MALMLLMRAYVCASFSLFCHKQRRSHTDARTHARTHPHTHPHAYTRTRTHTHTYVLPGRQEWHTPPITGPIPQGRAAHCMASDGGSLVFVFGGVLATGEYSDEVISVNVYLCCACEWWLLSLVLFPRFRLLLV